MHKPIPILTALLAFAITGCSSPDSCPDCMERCLGGSKPLPVDECAIICKSGGQCPARETEEE